MSLITHARLLDNLSLPCVLYKGVPRIKILFAKIIRIFIHSTSLGVLLYFYHILGEKAIDFYNIILKTRIQTMLG